EFLTIWRRMLEASHERGSIDFDGKHLRSSGGKVLYPPVQRPHPPLWFGGSSAAAHEIAGDHIDIFLTGCEPPDEVVRKMAGIHRRAAGKGLKSTFGPRRH